MEGKIIRRVGQRLAMSWAALVMGTAVSGGDGTSTTPDKQPTTKTQPAAGQSAKRVPPSPPDQTKRLRARVIKVKRTAKWRPSDKTKWNVANVAKVDDWLDPGVQIRTGMRSSIELRVGEHTTIILERMSLMVLPLILQDGPELRTLVVVVYGRARFIVDKDGLTNHLEVLTPTLLAKVEGTEFAVTWGALEGVEIDALAPNGIHAIEVRYLLTNRSYYLSGPGATRENQPDPVEVALGKTVSGPIPGGLSEREFLTELRDLRRVDHSRIGLAATLGFVLGFERPCVSLQECEELQRAIDFCNESNVRRCLDFGLIEPPPPH
ncbi:MAG: FecR domain-containing protein [Phycisphaerales bacterium]